MTTRRSYIIAFLGLCGHYTWTFCRQQAPFGQYRISSRRNHGLCPWIELHDARSHRWHLHHCKNSFYPHRISQVFLEQARWALSADDCLWAHGNETGINYQDDYDRYLQLLIDGLDKHKKSILMSSESGTKPSSQPHWTPALVPDLEQLMMKQWHRHWRC